MSASVAHLDKMVARNARLLKAAWKTAARHVQERLPPSVRPSQVELQPLLARNVRHSLHPLAALRQSKGRWYTTHSSINAAVRRFTASASQNGSVKVDRFPKSRIGAAVKAFPGRAPFATTLRPNLTGGTLNRTAGGYGLGFGGAGGARYFSHTSAAPSQVVHNVSQAVRAFLISGQKAQYNGVDRRTGEKRFKSVSALQDKVDRKLAAMPKATPGSYVQFSINPTITALTPLSSVAGFSKANVGVTLHTDGLLDALSVDFSRALKELAMILNDLKRLSALGDLPITYHETELRVHFPGCDLDSVSRLCDEVGIQSGSVIQDGDFDAFVGTEVALLFPFAPSKVPSESSFFTRPVHTREQIDWRNMLVPEGEAMTSSRPSTHTEDGFGFEKLESENPWVIASPSSYESVNSIEIDDGFDECTPLEYQGFEGIYRFLEQCESSRRSA